MTCHSNTSTGRYDNSKYVWTNDTFWKYKAKVYRLKKEIEKFAIIILDFNTPISVTDRIAGKN